MPPTRPTVFTVLAPTFSPRLVPRFSPWLHRRPLRGEAQAGGGPGPPPPRVVTGLGPGGAGPLRQPRADGRRARAAGKSLRRGAERQRDRLTATLAWGEGRQ